MKHSAEAHTHRRFFIEPDTIKDSNATIKGPDANHIKNVLRMKKGDTVFLFDGGGMLYFAEIAEIKPNEIHLTIRKTQKEPEAKTQIILAQSFLKDKKMDVLVRQLTELGVTTIIPFFSERSIPNPDAKRIQKRLERWEKIARESLKQCKRNRLPEIAPPHSFKELMNQNNNDTKLIFWENESQPLKETLSLIKIRPKKILIVLGPEGGFSPKEIQTATENNFISASLGPRILKAETASVAALTLIQFFFGDLG